MARARGGNLWRQVVAVLVAAGLWFLFGGQTVVERAIRVPLEFTNLPSGIEMTGEVPSVVDLRVRGSEAVLARIAPGELVAVLNLAGAGPGQRLFHVTGDDVRAPAGVTVVQVTPSSVAVGFEPSASKLVPVSPTVQGMPAFGFEVGTITSTPPAVEVFGPAGALAGIQAVITEPLSVAGASSAVTGTVTVGVSDRTLRVGRPQRVTVAVEVRPAPVERIVSGVPVEIRGGRAAVSEPAAVTVTLKAAAPVFDDLPAGSVRAFVDAAGARSGAARPVQIETAAGVAVVRIEPAQVTLRAR
ncbi:MAG: CdaR family protein [Vicinamibacterales bacterium]